MNNHEKFNYEPELLNNISKKATANRSGSDDECLQGGLTMLVPSTIARDLYDDITNSDILDTDVIIATYMEYSDYQEIIQMISALITNSQRIQIIHDIIESDELSIEDKLKLEKCFIE